MAFHDALTLLPNRRLLLDRLSHAISTSKRGGHHNALLFLDMDNFKELNDQYGHEAGDLLLTEVARRLTACVREIDTVARFGGDEFAVLLSELPADRAESTAQAGIVAEKIRIRLAEPYCLTLQHTERAEHNIRHCSTASIGLAIFNDGEASPDDLIQRADAAMYLAKTAGRNRVRFYQ
jgi:diguanylate cyclase (GGDEF)-like protein